MFRFTRFFVLPILVVLGISASSSERSKPFLLTFQTSTAPQIQEIAERLGLDVVEMNSKKSTITIVSDLDPLKTEQLFIKYLEPSTQLELIAWEESRPYRAVRAESVFTDGTEQYWDYDETVAALNAIEQANPTIAKVINLNDLTGLDKTSEGREMFALQVSHNPAEVQDEPKILYIGQHHARELMTHHAVVDIAKELIAQYKAGDKKSVAAVSNSAIWFVPVVNPDGLEYVFDVDRMWRKNRSVNSDQSRGVDLNRNYEFKWGECGSNSASPRSDIFKGSKAQSEPEIRVMDALNNILRAQFVISFHSAGDEVLYPYRCGDVAEEDIYYDIRDRLAKTLSFGQRYASSSGEDFAHHYGKYGSISFLLEIGQSFQPDFDVYQGTVLPTVKKTLPFLINELNRPFVTIKVKDGDSLDAVSADLKISSLNFSEGEIRNTDKFGTYRWLLKDGTHKLTVSAKGYETREVSVSANGVSSDLTIKLERD